MVATRCSLLLFLCFLKQFLSFHADDTSIFISVQENYISRTGTLIIRDCPVAGKIFMYESVLCSIHLVAALVYGGYILISTLLPCSNVDRIRDFIKSVYVDKRYIAGKASDNPPGDMQANFLVPNYVLLIILIFSYLFIFHFLAIYVSW